MKMNEQEYAGFWIRAGATLIDVIVLLIVIAIPLSFIYGEEYWTGNKLYYGYWDGILNYVLPFVATIWFWRRFLGTLGKILVGVKIVDAKTGDKMSVGQSVARYFAYLISMIPFGLGFI